MTVLENYLAIHLGGLSNIFYRNSVVHFREQKPLFLKIVFFSHLAKACVRESIGLETWDWACRHK